MSLAKEAENLLANQAWRKMWELMKEHLEDRAQICPTIDKEMAVDIIRCKQLLTGIEREFNRMIESEKLEEWRKEQIQLIEPKKSTQLKR